MNKMSLTIGWLYPDLMSTYGDRGNIITLQKRCEWRGITTHVLPITLDTPTENLRKIDLIFGGGAQDREQEIVMRDLQGSKGKMLRDLIIQEVPALFVCGSPQLMGKYYEPAAGKRIEGLNIFDMVSVHPGEDQNRLIGNVVASVIWENLDGTNKKSTIVGFENHGGRTYLGKGATPFAKIIKGNGNNGEDETEGVVFKNAIGCYFHGPLLPKNPEIADWLIARSLTIKYKMEVSLLALDDSLENKTRDTIVRKIGVGV